MENFKKRVIMHIIFILLSICLSIHLTDIQGNTETPTTTIPLPAITLNVYATPNNTSYTIAHNDTTTTSLQTSAHTTDINQTTTVEVEAPSSSLHNAIEALPSLWTQFKQECTNHKWHIVGGTCLVSYFILCGILIKDNFYLNHPDLWARWKYDQTLTSLCVTNQEALRKELIVAIQQRHLDPQNPTDYIKPLTKFIATIETEKKWLEAYCKRAAWIKTLHLSAILPINDAKITLAQNLVERLQFINSLFITWASEYNWEALL